MINQIFVSPNGKDWKVKIVGNQKASAICDTKAEAVERAKKKSYKNNILNLIIQNRLLLEIGFLFSKTPYLIVVQTR